LPGCLRRGSLRPNHHGAPLYGFPYPINQLRRSHRGRPWEPQRHDHCFVCTGYGDGPDRSILGTCCRGNGFCRDGCSVNFQTHRSLEKDDPEGNFHAGQSAQRTMKISFIRWFLLLMCLDSIIPYSKPKGGDYHGNYHRERLWSGCA
jgi:hypothetical protein